jgi:hypothetical protein
MGGLYDLRYLDGVPSLMNIGTRFQTILKFCLMKFEKLQCLYYLWEGLMMYTVEMGLGGKIYLHFS